MIKYKFYDKTRNLMKTYSDNPDKDLQKVGTNEVYSADEENAPIDLIDHIEIDNGQESPRSRFNYIEVDKKRNKIE